ncbi:MAG: hypothetical protein QOH81_2515 [Sphingomonadales bacterium]|jgi:hypothetical protein|nr:hypothetical protein [Sphingomonadales bacterium]
MRSIIIVMLCVQAAMVLVAAFTIVLAKPTPGRRRPIWSSLALSLIVTASVSWQIADRHDLSSGARLLQYGSGLLLGMGLTSLFVLLRQRLGTDAIQ